MMAPVKRSVRVGDDGGAPFVALIGAAGVGKTAVGSTLAARLSVPFVALRLDEPQWLDTSVRAVAGLADRGVVCEIDEALLASGRHRDLLAGALVVFLDASEQVLAARRSTVAAPQRSAGRAGGSGHSADGPEHPGGGAEPTPVDREFFRGLAGFRLDTGHRSVNEITDLILQELVAEQDRPPAAARAVSGRAHRRVMSARERARAWSDRGRDARMVELIALLRQAADHVMEGADLVLAGQGLNRGQFDVLAALYRSGPDGPVTQAELADRMLVTPAGVKKRLTGLFDRGYVNRFPDPDDARKFVLQLTPEGEGFLLGLLDEFFAAEADALVALDSAEQRDLAHLLRNLLGQN